MLGLSIRFVSIVNIAVQLVQSRLLLPLLGGVVVYAVRGRKVFERLWRLLMRTLLGGNVFRHRQQCHSVQLVQSRLLLRNGGVVVYAVRVGKVFERLWRLLMRKLLGGNVPRSITHL